MARIAPTSFIAFFTQAASRKCACHIIWSATAGLPGHYYFNAGSNSATAPRSSAIYSRARLPERSDRGCHPLRHGMSSAAPLIHARRKGPATGAEFAGQGRVRPFISPGDAPDVEDRKARPKMASEMNREESGAKTKRLYVSFHSNAFNGSARGTVGFTTTPTHANRSGSPLDGQEVTADMVSLNAQLEFPWHDRGSGSCSVALTWKSVICISAARWMPRSWKWPSTIMRPMPHYCVIRRSATGSRAALITPWCAT